MSLILDALKKLERDKNAREPGVLVVGSVPWGERRRSRLPLAFAAAALVALAFAGWWWLRSDPAPDRRRAHTRRARTRRTRTRGPCAHAVPDGGGRPDGSAAGGDAWRPPPPLPRLRPAAPPFRPSTSPPARPHRPREPRPPRRPARPRTTCASTRSRDATAVPWLSSTTGSCSRATASTASRSCASARPRSRSRSAASAASCGSSGTRRGADGPEPGHGQSATGSGGVPRRAPLPGTHRLVSDVVPGTGGARHPPRSRWPQPRHGQAPQVAAGVPRRAPLPGTHRLVSDVVPGTGGARHPPRSRWPEPRHGQAPQVAAGCRGEPPSRDSSARVGRCPGNGGRAAPAAEPMA